MTARTGLFTAPVPGILAAGSAPLPTYATPPAGTAPTDGRLVIGALLGTTAQCLAGGVITASASSMQFTISQSVWAIPDPSNAAAMFASPTDVATVTLSAGPASGTRTDTIWVKQDNYENSDADSRCVIGVTAGSGGVPPVLAAGQLKITNVLVPTNASNAAACTLTQPLSTTLASPNVSAASAAALALWPGVYVGQRGYVGTTEYRWSGTAWVLDRGDIGFYYPSGYLGDLGASPDTSLFSAATGAVEGVLNCIVGGVNIPIGPTLIQLASNFPRRNVRFRADFYNPSSSSWTGQWAIFTVTNSGGIGCNYVTTASNSGQSLFGNFSYAM